MTPLTASLDLGDFGQIRQSRLIPLGNICKLRLVYPIKSTGLIPLNPWDWQMESGIGKSVGNTQTQSHILEDSLESQNAWITQALTFKQKGGFVFHGSEPKAQFIANWSEFKQDITLKLTQTDFSFRDVYVVTAIASVNQWGLAIAEAEGAELEIAAQTSEADCFAMLSHQTVIALQSRNIARFEKSAGRTAYFFKAKKLVLSDKKYDHMISQMLNQNCALEPDEPANWLSSGLINRVQANELTPTTCLEFFDWTDTTLDDVEKLC